MKKFLLFLLISVLFFVPAVIFAQSSQEGRQIQKQDRVQAPVANFEQVDAQGDQVQNQVQNQNQVQTQNQNEESQLMIQTQEAESLQSQNNEGSNAISSRNEVSREHMSQVAKQVEVILASPDRQGGIGDQVKEIAMAQKQTQVQMEVDLDKVESKSKFSKMFFGPDYKAIKNLNQQLEQNELRIQQLQQFSNQVENKSQEIQLQEMIQAMVEQNTALKNQIQAEEKLGSVFGWLAKLFNN